MKVLFLKDNLPTAMAGEIKEVKPGFARNFLIPQGIAELANKSSIERVEKLRKQAEVRRGEMKAKWQTVATEINLLNLEIVAQTGPTGKLFGSVTNSQIASSIEENLDGVTIDRRSIRITQPIKMIGSYKVPMKLFEGVDAEVNLLVKSDGNVMTEEMVEITEGKAETEIENTDEDSPSEDLTEEKSELPSEEVEKEESAPEIESSEEE
tara:strand:+ start:221 stop:847 length:627 start_codon:yes stop_codon:yes gene_type:complete